LLDAVRGQPRTVWITAFAAVIAFMGIGLVDPILVSIAEGLHATPSQVTLLFSSYLAVQVLAMLLTGSFTARFGAKRTILVGLALIVVFAGACTFAGSIGVLVGLRAFWGMGNAFFIATALSVIVGAASGGQTAAILLYEAALGLGLSTGPLLGAALGNLSWRLPFAGTAVLMALAFVLALSQLPKDSPTGSGASVREPLRALRHQGLRRVSLGSALYTAAFFTILAWSPFVLHYGAVAVGLVFFGWGLCVAVSSVALAPRLARHLGERAATTVVLLAYAVVLAGFVYGSKPVIVGAIIVSGLCSGFLNTFFTGMAMSASPAPRPVASAGYNFCRWLGGAAAATLVGHVADWMGSDRGPFVLAIVLSIGSAAVVSERRLPRLRSALSSSRSRQVLLADDGGVDEAGAQSG
jgi:predicted MFS family arabinose efflux permease